MTNLELIQLFKGLNSCGNLKGVKFSYAVIKNINKIKPEVEAIEKTLQFSEEFGKFDKERIELAKKYAKKDDKGEAEIKNDTYVMEDTTKFDEEFLALKETYKKEIEEREKQIEEYQNLLKEEAKIELHKVNLENVPEDIETKQMNSIYAIIEE